MQILSGDDYRKKLAGIIDPAKKLPGMEEKIIREEAIKFCSILPELFSDDFDRKTLWERIGNGVVSACKKSGKDVEMFVNLVLEFIKADPGRVAANDKLLYFLESMNTKPEEWKSHFMYVMEKKYNIMLVYARAAWNQRKSI